MSVMGETVANKYAGRFGERRSLDDYETPGWATRVLLKYVRFEGTVLEPACGSGRMVRVLRAAGHDVTGTDIKDGHDFLDCSDRHDNVVTNPPYREALPEAFFKHAFDDVARDRVSLLVGTQFLSSQRRSDLFNLHPPELIVMVAPRILFVVEGVPLVGQAHDHCWVTWRRGFAGRASVVWDLSEEGRQQRSRRRDPAR